MDEVLDEACTLTAPRKERNCVIYSGNLALEMEEVEFLNMSIRTERHTSPR